MGTQPPAEIVAAARGAAARWKIPACVLIAQWALESGWGRHMPPGSHNPFGEKALPRDPCVAAPTSEWVKGRLVPTNAPFRAFPSVEDAFGFHAEHLATSHWFAAARGRLPDVAAFCEALGHGTPQRPSYSTSPAYGAELMAVIRGSDLAAYDA